MGQLFSSFTSGESNADPNADYLLTGDTSSDDEAPPEDEPEEAEKDDPLDSSVEPQKTGRKHSGNSAAALKIRSQVQEEDQDEAPEDEPVSEESVSEDEDEEMEHVAEDEDTASGPTLQDAGTLDVLPAQENVKSPELHEAGPQKQSPEAESPLSPEAIENSSPTILPNDSSQSVISPKQTATKKRRESEITEQRDLFTKDGQLGPSFKEGIIDGKNLSLDAIFLADKTSRSSVSIAL